MCLACCDTVTHHCCVRLWPSARTWAACNSVTLYFFLLGGTALFAVDVIAGAAVQLAGNTCMHKLPEGVVTLSQIL